MISIDARIQHAGAVPAGGLDSVRGQLYPNWQLCIADDASTLPHVPRVLAKYAAADPRIRVVRRLANGGISAASNSAFAIATGEFVALFDHDDVLPVHALYLVAREILSDPAVDLIYSDEDKLDRLGRRVDPYFNPNLSLWDPTIALAFPPRISYPWPSAERAVGHPLKLVSQPKRSRASRMIG